MGLMMSGFNDLPDEDAAPVLRAKLDLILTYMDQIIAELDWRRSHGPAEDTPTNRCPSVNLCSMRCEVQLTRGEFLKGRTAKDLDADANLVINRMNGGTAKNS
jgi:hypothetical protein